MTILLADDDPILRRIAAIGLRSDDNIVLEAENAETALALANHHFIDVLVTDVVMPDMDGFSLACAIRSLDRRSDLLILFISGYPLEDQITDYGRCAFVPKPFTLVDLTEALDRLSASSRKEVAVEKEA